jgi:hypothetical protein
MITLIKNIPDDIVGFSYGEEVTAADYETVVFPAVDAAAKKSSIESAFAVR